MWNKKGAAHLCSSFVYVQFLKIVFYTVLNLAI